MGVPVNVINKPGGAHIPATVSVLEAPADGYTLFQWSPPSFMVVPLTREVPYDPVEDFVPIFADQTASNALYVRADSPYGTFEEFIEGAKQTSPRPGSTPTGSGPASRPALRCTRRSSKASGFCTRSRHDGCAASLRAPALPPTGGRPC